MLTLFNKLSDSVSFKIAWSRQKSLEKKNRWKELLTQFPAESLEQKTAVQEKRLKAHIRCKYEVKAKEYERLAIKTKNRRAIVNNIERILTRNFEQDLIDCYERIERIKRRHVIIKSDLTQAYLKHTEAKNDIDSWYEKSKRSGLLFGNNGKKIPNYSFFGQSVASLDIAKARRNEAGDRISKLKREKEMLNSDFEQLNQKIQTIRDEECEHRKLLSEGITFALIKLESAQLNKKMSELTLNKQKLQAMHEEELKRELNFNKLAACNSNEKGKEGFT